MRKTIKALGRWTAVGSVLLTWTACERAVSPSAPSPGGSVMPLAHGGVASQAAASALDELRRNTARFHDIEQAAAAGWDTPVTPCQESGEGGMGIHYANLPLIDGSVNAQAPEIIMYEPRGDGTRHLVGVEFIVPIGLWTGGSPPSLFGEHFHRNDALGLWVLHVWVWKPNPSGMFADWNPNVSCP